MPVNVFQDAGVTTQIRLQSMNKKVILCVNFETTVWLDVILLRSLQIVSGPDYKRIF